MYTLFFFFNDTATTKIYTLPLHDALPISSPPSTRVTSMEESFPTPDGVAAVALVMRNGLGTLVPSFGPSTTWFVRADGLAARSEEHTSELQSPCNLVCRLLLEKKKHIIYL